MYVLINVILNFCLAQKGGDEEKPKFSLAFNKKGSSAANALILYVQSHNFTSSNFFFANFC